jgi:tRNA 5-methylaminomethyl-2-thiouridine biosynthesis bifunctional protein
VTIEDLIKSHHAWPELADYAKKLQANYPSAIAGCHRLVLEDGLITLDLWFGDIHDSLPQVPTWQEGLVDAWFLDGFAPSKNPAMWNQDLFNGMVKLAKKECTVATFTAAGFVRRGLIEAGFTMRKAKGFGRKRDMIVGTLETKTAYTNIANHYSRAHSKAQLETMPDVAIIGGGIAAMATAHSLISRGITVHLYCKDNELACGASKNLQGAVYPLLSDGASNPAQFFAPAFEFAHSYYDNLREHIEFDHQWCGVTQLMWCEQEATKLNKIADADYPINLVRKLSSDETNQTVGLDVNCASLHYPKGGWLSPQQLIRALAEHLQQTGKLHLHLNHKVESLVCENGHWKLDFSNQSAKLHGVVVIASGHLFEELSQSKDTPLTKVKGQVTTVPSSKQLEKLRTVLCYEGYMTPKSSLDDGHRIGASYDKQNIDEEFDASVQQSNKEKLTHCLPNAKWTDEINVSHDNARQGIRSVSRDHLAFVGNACGKKEIDNLDWRSLLDSELPQQRNLYTLLGLGSRGLTAAPLLAEILAAQITGQPIPLSNSMLEAIHPARMWVRKTLRENKQAVKRHLKLPKTKKSL